jgi:hypothetical protein
LKTKRRRSCRLQQRSTPGLRYPSVRAIEGPDTDTLTAPYRQNGGKGTHFNDAGLKAHGLLWADKVSQYLDTILRRTVHQQGNTPSTMNLKTRLVVSSSR